jgi:hypothetical protein
MSKPLSEKQLAANRTNGRKSRGPITPGGRRNSSLNATRHGLYAQTILLPGESRDRFLKLLSDLTTEFNATTPSELDLVETMAFCRWRVLRSWTHQASHITNEQRIQSLQSDSITDEDPPTQTVAALQSLNQPPSLLETLSRLEVRYDRQYYRAADRLRRLKRENEERSRAIVENKEQSSSRHPIRPVNDP